MATASRPRAWALVALVACALLMPWVLGGAPASASETRYEVGTENHPAVSMTGACWGDSGHPNASGGSFRYCGATGSLVFTATVTEGEAIEVWSGDEAWIGAPGYFRITFPAGNVTAAATCGSTPCAVFSTGPLAAGTHTVDVGRQSGHVGVDYFAISTPPPPTTTTTEAPSTTSTTNGPGETSITTSSVPGSSTTSTTAPDGSTTSTTLSGSGATGSGGPWLPEDGDDGRLVVSLAAVVALSGGIFVGSSLASGPD